MFYVGLGTTVTLGSPPCFFLHMPAQLLQMPAQLYARSALAGLCSRQPPIALFPLLHLNIFGFANFFQEIRTSPTTAAAR